jgi:exosortase
MDMMSEERILYKRILPPVALGLLTAVLYFPVIVPLVRQWLEDGNYRHGLAIPIISGIILWTRRKHLTGIERDGGTVTGYILVLLAAGLLIGGTAASEFFTARLSLPLMLLGFSYILGGVEFVRRARFPLLFLFMMIPLPYIIYFKITFPMQIMSARLSASLLDLIHISVIRRGNILVLPNYELEVVAACSGLRSLMTMITLALVISVLSDLTPARKTILVLCAVPAAVIANTLRLAVTAVGAYSISTEFAEGTLHEISGLIVFFAGFMLLFIALGILRWSR